MVIQHNMQAMNTNRQLGISVGAAAKSTEKLSSGYRINRAGDDAAGLAISEKMRSQIRGLDRASANSQDGISLIQTAEGALNETQSILQRMRELAVQAANGTNTDSDRNEIQKEVNQLTSEINRIANTTEFNTMKLLKGNTNKAEIGGVDTETLVNGEKGVTQGAIDNFNVDKESKKAVDSSLTLVGNQAAATGALKGETLDEDVAGVAGEYATARVGGLQFGSTDKDVTLNDKKINIVTINDNTPDGTSFSEGILKNTNTGEMFVVLKQSTIDDLATAQELITKIENMSIAGNAGTGATGSGSTLSGLVDAGVISTAAAATLTDTDLSSLNIKVDLPTEIQTADDLRNYLPTSVGSAEMKTDTFGGGKKETIGEYTFELDKSFKEEGDKITVGGETFTTKLSGAKGEANEVGLGSSSAAITFKLEGKIGSSGTAAGDNKLVFSTGATFSVTVNLDANDSAKDAYEKLKASAAFTKDFEAYFNEDTGYMTIARKQGSGISISNAAVTAPSGKDYADEAALKFTVELIDKSQVTAGMKINEKLASSGTASAPKFSGAVGVNILDSGTYNTDAKMENAKKLAQAQNLALAMNANANLNKDYHVEIKGASGGLTAADIAAGKVGTIVIKENANKGGIAKTGTGLDLTLSVAGSGGEDDTITITNPNGMNGVEFEIVAANSGKGADVNGTAGAGPSGKVMSNGVTIGQDANNKNKFYINLGTTANGNKASKIQQALREFTQSKEATLADGTKISFKDFEVSSAGNWDSSTTNASNINHGWSATAGGVEEQKGTYSFDITEALAEGDKIMIAGKEFIAKVQGADINKGELDVSSKDKATQAKKLKDLLGADADIAAKYDIKLVNGTTKLTLIEKAASGEDMTEEDVSVQATGTQGQFKVDEMELQKDGASITIDGQKIDFTSKNAHVGYENGTAIKVTDTVEDQKTALAAAINKNAELSKKYEASISEDGSLMLTQKVGSEEEPEITTTSSTKGTFDVTFQVGANTGQSMTIAIGDNRANALGVAGDGTEESIMADNGATAYYTKVSNVTDGTTNDNIEFALDVTSFEKATAAIGVIDDALSSISAQRSQLGAYQNRLEHTIANLDNTSENLQSSESRIRDVDMAKEMTNFSKNNILQQAAQSMLAQANQSTQGVLTLLR